MKIAAALSSHSDPQPSGTAKVRPKQDGCDMLPSQLQLAIERCLRASRLLLVVYRPSERLENPTACTALGVAEDRVMTVAADRDRFSTIE